MSISGWRKIFSHDERLESNDKKLNSSDQHFVILVAHQIRLFFQRRKKKIVLARDSRPTGLAIENILAKMFSIHQLPYLNLKVTSLPQVLALVKKQFSGFVYITASHNPVGYNGFKIGEGNGEVLSAGKSTKLITDFKELFFDPKRVSKVINDYFVLSRSFSSKKRNSQDQEKAGILLAELAYHDLINRVNGFGHKTLLKKIQKIPHRKIVCDFNGSSRLRSADKKILAASNIGLIAFNKKLGFFNHQIVPEGEGLNDLKKYLLNRFDENILWGYAVDCDGDRGNFRFL